MSKIQYYTYKIQNQEEKRFWRNSVVEKIDGSFKIERKMTFVFLGYVYFKN